MGHQSDYAVEPTTFRLIFHESPQPQETLTNFFERMNITDSDPENCLIIAATSVNIGNEIFGALVSTADWNMDTELTSSTQNLLYQNHVSDSDGSRLVRLTPMVFECAVQYMVTQNGRLPSQVIFFRSMYTEDFLESISTEVEGIRVALKHIYQRRGAPEPKVEFIYMDETEGFEGRRTLFRLEAPVMLPDEVPMLDESLYTNAKFALLGHVEPKNLPAIILESICSCYECIFNTC